MRDRVNLNVTMELQSDAIFGSGHSIPGGEDIAVCTDDLGYPYLKGTTLKGLLRESTANYLSWTGGDESELDDLFGREDWNGEAENRRISFTSMVLENPPADPTACFGSRIFTSLENKIAKTGSLREAVCICRGQRFTGRLTCAREDADLLHDALACIKWAGTMRSRGFGRVRIWSEPKAAGQSANSLQETPCIHYILRTELPVLVTDLSRSYGNGYETRNYIPGSAVRGLVASRLAGEQPEWFGKNKEQLLQDTVFLDAVPNPSGLAPLPAIKGFYEDKAETRFHSVLSDGKVPGGMKRAKLGAFNAIDGDTVRCWNARTGGVTRIQRNNEEDKDSVPFQTRYLEAGQDFEGYILLRNPALAPEIAKVLPETVWLGADRYEGFGKCSVKLLEETEQPEWRKTYGYDRNHLPDTTLYVLALSPLTMLDQWGEPCGLDLTALGGLLGVKIDEAKMFCSTSMSEYGCYNRTWQCREPMVRMYDRGSIFKLECSTAPDLDRLLQVQRDGLGIRRSSGCGEILFLRPELLEGIRRKQTEEQDRTVTNHEAAALRVKKYQWIAEQCRENEFGAGLSASQLGSIQALCQQARAAGGDLTELEQFFGKNLHERGAKHASRFRKADRFLHRVLDHPLEETLGVPCHDSMDGRLALVCMLIDHSRKKAER